MHQQAVDVPQKSVQALTGHTLAETKKAFFEANTEWKDRTLTEYSVNIDKFVKWAISKKVFNVEDVTKTHIIEFKAYMDKQGFAPNTKQKVLTRLGSMFKFAVDVKEWLPKNPITGMMYKKVGVVNKKEEITPEQFNQALSDDDLQTYWAMNLLYHCGLRVSELSQLTKNDYREIEGIKYISINSDDNKTVKNESSIRNIPLNKALLALGAWEDKPVMKYGDNRTMNAITKAFDKIGLKRSTHCFRHSLSNRLRDTNATDSIRAYILGHAQANMTDRVYITREPLLQMKAALDVTGGI